MYAYVLTMPHVAFVTMGAYVPIPWASGPFGYNCLCSIQSTVQSGSAACGATLGEKGARAGSNWTLVVFLSANPWRLRQRERRV